jgi:hypothetical protein
MKLIFAFKLENLKLSNNDQQNYHEQKSSHCFNILPLFSRMLKVVYYYY